MTELACLDGPATAAVSDQLVAVYRAAMGAPPFSETEVETGWFVEELAGELTEAGFRCWVASAGGRTVGFAYGFPTPEIPFDGWYGLLREAVGPDAERWLARQFAVVWIAVDPGWRGRGLGRRLLERLPAGPAPSGPGWSPTTWTVRPAPSTAPWGSGSWSRPPRLARRRPAGPRRRPPAERSGRPRSRLAM